MSMSRKKTRLRFWWA